MNLLKQCGDKELFSGEQSSKEITMNLLKQCGDKELFSVERSSKENTILINYYNNKSFIILS
jgi:hypothetical protein